MLLIRWFSTVEDIAEFLAGKCSLLRFMLLFQEAADEDQALWSNRQESLGEHDQILLEAPNSEPSQVVEELQARLSFLTFKQVLLTLKFDIIAGIVISAGEEWRIFDNRKHITQILTYYLYAFWQWYFWVTWVGVEQNKIWRWTFLTIQSHSLFNPSMPGISGRAFHFTLVCPFTIAAWPCCCSPPEK